jgi:general stress protein 26
MHHGAELDQGTVQRGTGNQAVHQLSNEAPMSSESTPPGDREQFHDLLESFNTVALITHARMEGETGATPASDIEVTSRPMQVARLDDNCDLWFLTDAETAKVYEIKAEPHVHVIGQDDRSRLSGTARVLKDSKIIHELWSEPYEVWFPEGPDSPGIRAIHVSAQEGEYWDSKGMNKIKYLLQAAKAYATGTTPNTDRDQQGRVQL